MKKTAIFLVLVMLLACMVSCGDDTTKTPETTDNGTVESTGVTDSTTDPEETTEEETETDAPETPQYDWTQRY